MKYVAFDAINGEHEHFATIEEAREWLEESFLADGEGYHPDLVGCEIFELKEKVEYDVLAKKADYTEEEWADAEYPEEFDEIWKHRFVSTT
jgi:hypothetical protein